MSRKENGMKRIWAPWRMEYIRSAHTPGCFLCAIRKSREDQANLVIHRGKTCFILMNRYPYNGGHLMVAPYRHVAELHRLRPAEQLELMQLTSRATILLKKVCKPQGFNVGLNLGEAAGAGLKDHLHMHVVPRWSGDTNFMPVFADIKIIPQALEELHQALCSAQARLPQ